jgi:hypothetical protein
MARAEYRCAKENTKERRMLAKRKSSSESGQRGGGGRGSALHNLGIS